MSFPSDPLDFQDAILPGLDLHEDLTKATLFTDEFLDANHRAACELDLDPHTDFSVPPRLPTMHSFAHDQGVGLLPAMEFDTYRPAATKAPETISGLTTLSLLDLLPNSSFMLPTLYKTANTSGGLPDATPGRERARSTLLYMTPLRLIHLPPNTMNGKVRKTPRRAATLALFRTPLQTAGNPFYTPRVQALPEITPMQTPRDSAFEEVDANTRQISKSMVMSLLLDLVASAKERMFKDELHDDLEVVPQSAPLSAPPFPVYPMQFPMQYQPQQHPGQFMMQHTYSAPNLTRLQQLHDLASMVGVPSAYRYQDVMDQGQFEVLQPDKKKSHECPLCRQRFLRPEHVKRHLKSHSLAKPYVCEVPECGKRFNRKDNMKAHLRKIHGFDTKRSIEEQWRERESTRSSM